MPASTVIRTGHLLDVVAGEWVEGQWLVVDDDGRIEAVLGPGSAGADPTIDLSDRWVVPGLIDCHSHLIGGTEWAGIAAAETSAAEEALLGVRNARSILAAGFTTVRDVGTYRAFVDCALRDAIDAGWVAGPRMQCAGAYVTMPGGAGAVTGLARDIALPPDLRFGEVHDEADVRRVVHALLGGGATVIKTLATGAVLTRGTRPGVRELTEGQLRAAVETAAEYGAYVAAHAHGAEGIVTAARAGVRSIEHGSLLHEPGIEALLRHGTYLVADLYDGDWIAEEGRRAGWPAETLRKNDETTDAQRVGFGKAVAAGVRIAYGTDSGVFPHADAARQLAYYVRYGLSPLATLRSATIWAAELLGWQDRVGTLQVGHYADLVAVPADPLGDVTVLERPSVVIKGGRLVGAAGVNAPALQ